MRGVALAIALLAVLAGSAAASTIVGTTKSERLRGTRSADAIDAVAGGRDTVSCGGGRDIVNVDGRDRVAADCEIVSRRVSVDTLHVGGQHATEVEPSAAAWGTKVVSTFQVGRFDDGGATAIGWATSGDGGRTWRSGLLPGMTSYQQPRGLSIRASDPAVAYDALHATWIVATLGVSFNGGSNVAVSRSPDGLRWNKPVVVTSSSLASLAYDKEWIGCDNGATSPFRGSCYVVYSDFSGGRLAVQVSRDGGLTWSAAVTASADTRGDVSGALPLVQPNGAVTIVFLASDSGVFAVRSTDGGATWGTRVGISALAARVPRDIRVPPLPTATVDAAGRMYVAWSDCSQRVACDGNDIVLSASDDGATWTPLRRLPGLGADRFIPGLAADPSMAGRLGLVFYYRPTTDCTGGACRVSIAYIRSNDGGAAWTAPQRLDARALRYGWLATTSGGAFFGDYVGAAFAGRTFVPVFTLAQPPTGATKHEAMFSARLP